MRFDSVRALLLAGLGLLVPPGLAAQGSQVPSEYALKAAFLYNFSLYTEWPSVPAEAFNFCVLGKDPFGASLDSIARKTVHGKAIHIKRLSASSDMKACHLVFIPAAEQEQYARLAPFISGQPILTVTDATQVDEKFNMIMIAMVPEGNRFTFDINQGAAKTAGLSFSSKLLRLARNVR